MRGFLRSVARRSVNPKSHFRGSNFKVLIPTLNVVGLVQLLQHCGIPLIVRAVKLRHQSMGIHIDRNHIGVVSLNVSSKDI